METPPPWVTCFLTDIFLPHIDDRFPARSAIDYPAQFRNAARFVPLPPIPRPSCDTATTESRQPSCGSRSASVSVSPAGRMWATWRPVPPSSTARMNCSRSSRSSFESSATSAQPCKGRGVVHRV
jgi:hypothetical protein